MMSALLFLSILTYVSGVLTALAIIGCHNGRRPDRPKSHFSYKWALLSYLFVFGCLVAFLNE